MFTHDKPYLFRNTAMNLEYCADQFETADLGELEWNDPEEEQAARRIRQWCARYVAAYDHHHGELPTDTE